MGTETTASDPGLPPGLYDEMPKVVLDTVANTDTVLEFLSEIGKVPGFEPENLYSYFYHFPDKLEVPIRKNKDGEKAKCLQDVLPEAQQLGHQVCVPFRVIPEVPPIARLTCALLYYVLGLLPRRAGLY